MKKKNSKRLAKSFLSFLMAALLAFQGTEPIFVQAKEAVENMPRTVDFSRPAALSSLEEAGIEDNTSGEKDGQTEGASDSQSQEIIDGAEDGAVPAEDAGQAEAPVPDTEPEGEQTADMEEEEPPADVELKEPADYYPIPAEPEGELVAQDKNSRTYKTGEKQYTTLIGGYTGTYEDEDGKIQPVDNTLEVPEQKTVRKKARSAAGGSGTATGEVYQNKANDYVVTLPKNITEDAGMVIEKDDYHIEIIPAGGDYTHSVVKDNAILYNQVYDGIDVQYTVLGQSIKEDIVLYKPAEQTEYTYELKIPGLKAELKDNQVCLYPEDKNIDEAEYILEAPSMEDAAGEVSFHITLSLREEEGRTFLTVIPDAQWLADETRQYPVRIDPSAVSIGPSAFNMNGVEQGSPNAFIGDNNYPYVGYDDGIKSGNLGAFGTMHMICRTYIKVNSDFSMIPPDSKIDSASFSVSQRTAYSGGASQFGLYRVGDAWDLPLKWTNQPYNHTFIDVKNAAPYTNTYVNYDVKDLVNDWVQGTYANNGMVLKAIDEAAGLAAAMQCEVLNNRNSAYGPVLSIQWSPAEDPFLRDMSIDDTTVVLRPMTEKSLGGKLQFDAVFADGIAKSKSAVEYYLVPDEEAEKNHHTTDAKPLYTYPDSTEYNKLFPEANKYYSKDSNWQSMLYANLSKDKLYQIKAKASKEIDGEMVTGKEVTSDSFVIYEVKQFDTLPKIARYYGTSLKDIMKDNQVQDALAVSKNTLFIRNPQTNVPYNPPALTDIDKMKIDGALMGRGLHCEFGFEPVNLNTGNFYMDQTDASLNDLGGEFGITRSYNSKGTDQNSLFGRGWSFNLEQSLVQMEDGRLLYMRGDGSYLFFTKNEDGSYTAPAGYVYDLKSVSYEGTDHDEIGWELKDADQSIWSFDKYGVLRFVTDVDGFKTILEYDEDYNLNKICTPSGKEFGIKQDKSGYITEITLPGGGKLSYTYDKKGNLISAENADGSVRKYHYDDDSRMISWEDENGNTVITNTYDKEGRVVKQADAEGGEAAFEYGKGKTVTTDNEGNQTSYLYDDQYRTTTIIYPDGTKCLKSYNGENQLVKEVTANGTKTWTYDGFGNISSETREDGNTASYAYNEQNKLVSFTNYNGAVTSYEYDVSGNVAAQHQPDGTTVSFGYDELHRLISMTDGRGITSTFGYDGANLVSYTDGEGCTWSFAYDAMNRIISETDPLGNTKSVSYNGKGDVISEQAGDGGTVKYGLDGAGNITSITDAVGNVTSFTYDAMYNITGGTDPEGHKVSYQYNKNYQEILTTDAKGNTTAHEYDSMGRLIKETNEDFGTKLYEYDTAGNLVRTTDGEGGVTASVYNKQGLPLKVTDALGNVTQYSYDALGNETEVLHADGGSSKTTYDSMGRIVTETDELGAVLTYQYDANGNVISLSDDSGRTYNFEYDRNNNRIKETNPEGGVSLYTYDAAGRQVSFTDAEGRTETYTYDGAGRVTSVKNALGEVSKSEYDKNGRLMKSTDGMGGISSFTYSGVGNMTSVTDPLGNITAFKYDETDNLSQTIDALKGASVYEYDSAGNQTKMTDALGNTYSYTYDKNGNPVSVLAPDGTETAFSYDSAGRLVESSDAQGLTVTYEYDSKGRLIHSADNGGSSMSYTYDKAGNVLSQTDGLDRTVSFEYDKYGRLLKITEADGSVTSYEYDVMDRITAVTDAEGKRTSFTYDKAGNRLSMTEAEDAVYQYAYDKKNRIISSTDPLGASAYFKYDANDNVTEAVDENGIKTAYTYDANNNLTSMTDGNGGKTTYEYDELDRKIKEASPLKETAEYRYDALGNLTKYKDPMELITEYKYDSLGNMTEAVSPKGAVTKYTYDYHGNVTSITDPKGNETAYSMDLHDNVTKITQADGGEYSYSYDKAGRLTSMTSPLGYKKSFTYDKADNIVKETDSLKSKTSYTYDRVHRMTGAVDALGGKTGFGYDKFGNLISETDPLGRTSTYSYDLAGRLTQAADPLGRLTKYTYDPAGSLISLTKPGARTTSYGYDKNYNIVSVTDPMGYVEKMVYDKDNRVISETDALGQSQAYAYDKNGQVTSATDKRGFVTAFDYDAHGNVKTITDKSGRKTHREYDDNDNLVKVTDALGGITAYAYDNMDRLTAFTDAAGKKTTYTYDKEGNLTSLKDASGKTETFGYDEKGRLTSHTYASGKKISYDYDKLNELLKKSYEDAKGNETEEAVLYAYNSAGERISMEDATGKSSYETDALGRLTKVTSGSGKEVGYAYDEAGNLQEITYPDGRKTSYEYDLNDNLIKVTDCDGKVTRYSHNALNRVTEVNRGNGTKSALTYDEEDHVTRIVNICGSCGKEVSSYSYKYNEQGYIISEEASELEAGTRKEPSWEDWYNWGGKKKETSKADCEHQEKTVKTSREYEYDENYQLTRCTEKVDGGSKTVHNYIYDMAGNRTEYERIINGVTKLKYKYKYNDSNQLIKRTNAKIWGDPGTIYNYDGDGNLVKKCDKTNSADPVEYEYTPENRLKAVREGGTVLMAALYDGDNNKVFEIDNTYKWEDCYGDEVLIPKSQRTEKGDSPREELASLIKGGVNAKGYTLAEYVNDVNRENTQVLAEYSAEDTLRQAYTYGEEGTGERTAVAKSGESSYYLYDGRGSVTGVLSEKGTLTNSYRYDSYGNLTSGTPEAVNYYGYNGESANVKTGFQYLRARYYYAENGTFTTEDSDLGTKENPLTRNRYSYVMNNPLNYADPTGHRAVSPVAGGFKAVGKAIKTVSNAVKNITAAVSRGAAIVANSARRIGNAVRGTGGGTGQYYNSVVPIAELVRRLKEVTVKILCSGTKNKISGEANLKDFAGSWLSYKIGYQSERFNVELKVLNYLGLNRAESLRESLMGATEKMSPNKVMYDVGRYTSNAMMGISIIGGFIYGLPMLGTYLAQVLPVLFPMLMKFTMTGEGALVFEQIVDSQKAVENVLEIGGAIAVGVAGGLLYAESAGNATGQGTPTPEELAQEVPDRYKKVYKCKEYADSLEKSMVENGISGERIHIESDTGYIYSDKYGDSITTNGKHDAIKIGDTVYDNLSSTGIKYDAWLKDLGIIDYPRDFTITTYPIG